jgi:hypothetical protein
MQRGAVLFLVVALVATPLGGAALADSAPGVEPTNAAPAQDSGDAGVKTAIEPADRTTDAAGQRAATGQTQTIQKDITLHLTPGEPGAVDVDVTYDIPDSVTALRVGVPGDARDVESTAFTRTDGGYEWDGDTDPATLSLTLPANQSASGARSPAVTQDGTYSFVDTGLWAMITVPGFRSEWSWRNADTVTLTEDAAVAGEGSTGGEIAFLGPQETYTRTANAQTIRLTVPEAATLAASPEEVLDALAAASGRLNVGARDEDVWFAAAPTDADWGIRGVEYGGSDAWVLADASLEDAGNVWFHEYVHTRQDFRTQASGRWTTEAAAEYYSALLALRTGYVGFETFETYLSYGERSPWRDAVLSDPGTWPAGANYVKGSLVWGELDRQIRVATDSSHTMADVFYLLNQHDDRITNEDVLAAVNEVSTSSVRDAASRYTTTSDVPEMWTRTEHGDGFGTAPPQMNYEVTEYRVAGPFRNETYERPPSLYVGETVTVETVVTNDGEQTGEYEAAIEYEGTVLAATGGELGPGDSDRVTLGHTFAEPGTYELSMGRNPTALGVREPASVEVQDLSVSASSVSSGDDVTVTVQLSNPSDRYANGRVVVTLDGDEVASLDVTLAAGESTTRTVTVPVSSNGEHTFAAGDRTASVTASSGDDNTRTDTRVPGFDAGVALVAVALALLAALVASD